MIKQRHLEVSHRIIGELEGNPMTPNLRALADTTRTLTVHGFEPPGWRALAEGLRPQTRDPEEHEPGIVSGGWQHEAAVRVEWHTRSIFLSSMSDQALLRSQSGPGAGVPLSVAPASALTWIDSHLFVCCCSASSLALPCSAVPCRCGRPFDPFGHHRAACTRRGCWAGEGSM